ncbi:unnamed protein product [Ilex paraguariensis]|uniref:X8 domain-containing protein n=1 Tax=Ilex paraguariensis TaxID=185542 RepID=A0ABC8RK57_9AQUA
MAVFALCLVLFLVMTGCSSALYCTCKDGVGDSALQKSIDYACGAGADCTPITQNGPCYQPNTVKDHCNFAVNSYFQKKGQVSGSCDFSGTATPSQNPPSGQSSTCVYPSSSSNVGAPSTTNPNSTSSNTPSITTPGSTNSPTFSLGPTGNGGITSTDNSASVTLHQSMNLLYSFTLTLLFSGFLYLKA